MKENKGAMGKKAKRSNTKPIVTNSSQNTNVIKYPSGFKKWLKSNGFLIKEFGLYYDRNYGTKKNAIMQNPMQLLFKNYFMIFIIKRSKKRKNNMCSNLVIKLKMTHWMPCF